jgi:heat-inducible transcriptional repressor
MLDDRAKTLLKTLIERYIAEGQPVGSRALSRYSCLDLSAATVRNVMADLEDIGLIASPHTSAGRVPTSRGYRFFVDSLLTVKPLEKDKLDAIEGQLLPSQPTAIDQQCFALLSGLTHFAGIVLTPRRLDAEDSPDGVRQSFRAAHSADPGHFRRRRAESPALPWARLYPSELVTATNYLNQHFAGHDFEHISRASPGRSAETARGSADADGRGAGRRRRGHARAGRAAMSFPASATCSKSRSFRRT